MKRLCSRLLCFCLVVSVLVPVLPNKHDNVKAASDYESETKQVEATCSRDDGVWLFPLPSSYWNSFSDYAGCAGTGKCLICGVVHEGWTDTAHTQYPHFGVDISATKGTNVYAARGGYVYFRNYLDSTGRGRYAIVEHPIAGTDYSYYSLYQHLSSVNNGVHANGSWVDVADVVGSVGQSGTTETQYGAHLHFEVFIGKKGGGQALVSSGVDACTANYYTNPKTSGFLMTSGVKKGMLITNPKNSNAPSGLSGVGGTNGALTYSGHRGSITYTFDKTKVGGAPSTLSISNHNKVGTIKQGSSYTPNGVVKSNYNLDYVNAYILKSDGTTKIYEGYSHQLSNKKEFTLKGSSIMTPLKFNQLSPGTYYFQVTASDISGQAAYLVKEKFTVTSATHVHSLVKHNAVAATCEKGGSKAYWKCSSCGKMYSDSQGKTEIKSVATAAEGHKWGTGVITKKATMSATGVRTFTCSKCGKTRTETIPIEESDEYKNQASIKDWPIIIPIYKTHVQNVGWQNEVQDGQMSGTSGRSLRLEGICLRTSNPEKLGIQYTTHCQDYGWLPWSSNGEMSGTQGESKRLEAIMIKLNGPLKDKYDVYYRVHAQNVGWMNWAKNGQPAGTAGYAYRLEGIQVVIYPKGTSPAGPGNLSGGSYASPGPAIKSVTSEAYRDKFNRGTPSVAGDNSPNVTYRTHVQNVGWQTWKTNGDFSGTSGRSLRLEGINLKLSNKDYSGGIRYKTHIQNIGWETTWRSDGALSGTSGRSLRLEAIQIELYGEMKNHYDVYYRVHAQDVGWMGWAKNGASAGTAGYGRRLEGIQVLLVKKGGTPPSVNYKGIVSQVPQAYLDKNSIPVALVSLTPFSVSGYMTADVYDRNEKAYKDSEGKTYSSGISRWVPNFPTEDSYIEYDLKDYKRLQGKLILNYDRRAVNKECYFKVYGDGKLLYSSKCIKSGFKATDVNLDISNVRIVRIVFEGDYYENGSFVNPVVSK